MRIIIRIGIMGIIHTWLLTSIVLDVAEFDNRLEPFGYRAFSFIFLNYFIDLFLKFADILPLSTYFTLLFVKVPLQNLHFANVWVLGEGAFRILLN